MSPFLDAPDVPVCLAPAMSNDSMLISDPSVDESKAFSILSIFSIIYTGFSQSSPLP